MVSHACYRLRALACFCAQAPEGEIFEILTAERAATRKMLGSLSAEAETFRYVAACRGQVHLSPTSRHRLYVVGYNRPYDPNTDQLGWFSPHLGLVLRLLE